MTDIDTDFWFIFEHGYTFHAAMEMVSDAYRRLGKMKTISIQGVVYKIFNKDYESLINSGDIEEVKEKEEV